MKMFAFIILIVFCISTRAASLSRLQFSGKLSQEAQQALRDKIEAAGGCNGNVCFAIDGSGSIPAEGFKNEKNFVLDVASVIAAGDPNLVELSAVQFSNAVSLITPLSTAAAPFILAVNEISQLQGASFVTGGINKCFSLLFSRTGETNKIVLLSDGRSNIGSDAAGRADLFRSIGGSVCVVGAGFPDDAELLAIAGGNPDLVFEVKNFLDVLALDAHIEKLVEGICGIRKEHKLNGTAVAD